MNYDKRFFLLWGKVLGTAILAIAAFFGEFKRKNEIRNNERVMETLKKESTV